MAPRFALMLALALGGTAAVFTASAAAYQLVAALPTDRALPGTFVGGQVQPPDETLEGWLERRAARLGERAALLELPDGELIETTFGELGLGVDVEATAARVRAHATDGALLDRLARAWTARHGESELELEWRLDVARAVDAISRLHSAVDRVPSDARLDLRAHAKIAEVPGRRLDVPTTVARIAAGGRDELARFVVASSSVPAAVTTEMLLAVDVSRVLSTYETDFSRTGRGREANVAHAAELINGAVLAPGQRLSFNDLVGPRTLERGFTWAPEIYDDEMTTGIGGGTCQVSSTLHAAAVMGGLEIVRRRGHSRPSSYIPLGLDATVIHGEVDLVIANPHPSPLVVHAFVPEPGRLRIELLGAALEGEVKYAYSVLERVPFYRRITTKSDLEAAAVKKRQKGGYGYEVVSTVRLRRPNGDEETRHYRTEYRPTPEVYWIGAGVTPPGLPPLPEGADRTVVDGEEVAAATEPVALEGDG